MNHKAPVIIHWSSEPNLPTLCEETSVCIQINNKSGYEATWFYYEQIPPTKHHRKHPSIVAVFKIKKK